jgi:hypothetical protein
MGCTSINGKFHEVFGQKVFDRSTLYTINLQIKILPIVISTLEERESGRFQCFFRFILFPNMF